MTIKIAVAGKGGTGKTTLAGLLTRYLVNKYPGKSILAVDADANANFNEVLGVEIEDTVSEILAEVKDPKAVPTGMTKDTFVEYKLGSSMVETEAYDLLVMGNPQGPGCYCFPLDLLRKYIEKLAKNYDYMLTDNEAGLEHLSRRIIPAMDHLLVTSDATTRGLRSAGRVREIIESVDIDVGKMSLIITRGNEDQVQQLKSEIEQTGIELSGTMPYDSLIPDYDAKGKPLVELPADSIASQAVEKLCRVLGI